MKTKNYIFPVIILLTLVSGFLITFIRYSNQNMLLNKFSVLRTGNILTLLFLFFTLLFTFINLLNKSPYPLKTLLILLFSSAAAVGLLVLQLFIEDKDVKIFFAAGFLFIQGFVLVSMIELSFSKSKKLHFFTNVWLTVIIAFIGFVINFYQIYNYNDDSKYYFEQGGKADAGVILGAAVWGGKRPSPVLRERINKGFEIYDKKIVPRLILTGGGSPGELTEAEVARNELLKYKVNENNLIVENESNSTVEQIHFVRDGFYFKYNWNNIIIISDNFHLFRSAELCKFNNMNVGCISTDTPITTEGVMNFCLKESIAVLFLWFFGIG
ncbi:MAG: YdcF family protein [Ignavibacteria bacterium]|nr:YdcF family protein [Ignavibacteria bacterium]